MSETFCYFSLDIFGAVSEEQQSFGTHISVLQVFMHPARLLVSVFSRLPAASLAAVDRQKDCEERLQARTDVGTMDDNATLRDATTTTLCVSYG